MSMMGGGIYVGTSSQISASALSGLGTIPTSATTNTLAATNSSGNTTFLATNSGAAICTNLQKSGTANTTLHVLQGTASTGINVLKSETTTGSCIRVDNRGTGAVLEVLDGAVANRAMLGLDLSGINQANNLAPIRLANLGATPTGAAVIGDLCCSGGLLYICTTAGTPGTWTKVGTQV